MKESIHTIPLMDAFRAEDECPFCYLEREAEQHAISFALGSGASYMEDDVRAETDAMGFCRHHYKMMYDYGNRLGSGLILSTHLKKLNQELAAQMEQFAPGKSSVFKRMQKTSLEKQGRETALGQWIDEKTHSCYVCDHFKANYNRYLDTFFDLYKKLNDKQKAEFYPVLFKIMKENYQRLQEEVTWFTDKFDYRNKDKDWGNSRDSIQRCMQKLGGGYPADEPFTEGL